MFSLRYEGYGDAAPAMDYGYGDAAPEDYVYGDSAPDEYGYGDAEPAAAPPVDKKRPKRRCSVTKFSLEEQEGQSGLLASDVIKNFRNAAPPPPEPVVDDCKSTITDDTRSLDSDISPVIAEEAKVVRKKAGGMMSRLRKRMSVQ